MDGGHYFMEWNGTLRNMEQLCRSSHQCL